MLKHFESGRVELYVNGSRVGEKFQSAAFKSTHFTTALNDEKTVVMTVRFDESAKRVYQYTCALRPTKLAMRDDVESVAKALEMTERLAEVNEVKDTAQNPFVVTVDEAVVMQDENSTSDKKVVVFRVRTSLKSDVPGATTKIEDGAETVVVARRFSEFVDLRQTVRSALCGYHLYSDVPELPPKYNKLLQDHLDPAFIQRRQFGLDSFMKRLVELPRVSSNPELRVFLGLAPPLGSKLASRSEVPANRAEVQDSLVC